MRTRLRRALRLLTLQDRIHRLAEQEHAVLERRVQAADKAREDLIRALNEASAFHEPLRATALERLKSLAVSAQALRDARDASARQLRERATQHKRTALWVDRLEAQVRQQAERRDWAERLDLLTAGAASLPPARPASLTDESGLPATVPESAAPGDGAGPDPAFPETSAP
jgi:hypothetical protein